MTKQTKAQKAFDIFTETRGQEGVRRKDVIARFKDEVGLSDAGAATYYYNFTKGKTPKAPKNVEEAAAAPTETVEQTEAPAENDTIKARLARLNDLRSKAGKSPLKAWKKSRVALEEAIDRVADEVEAA